MLGLGAADRAVRRSISSSPGCWPAASCRRPQRRAPAAPQIAHGDLAAARGTARDIVGHAERADELTGGPVWWIAANLPGGGAALADVRTITAQIDALSPARCRNSSRPAPGSTHRAAGSGRHDPSSVRSRPRAAPLARADAPVAARQRGDPGRPAHTWLGVADTARQDLLTELDALGKTVHSADLAAHIAPVMLGADGPKRYFVAFQNDAEARGTGGLPGAFAIAAGRSRRDQLQPVRARHRAARGGRPASTSERTSTSSTATASRPAVREQQPQPALPVRRAHLAGDVGAARPASNSTAPSRSTRPRCQLPARAPPGRPPAGRHRVTAGNVVELTQSPVYARFAERSQNPQRKRVPALGRPGGERHRCSPGHADGAARRARAGPPAPGGCSSTAPIRRPRPSSSRLPRGRSGLRRRRTPGCRSSTTAATSSTTT